MTIEPGWRVSHYRLVEKIGEGGMGVVWKAEDTTLRRTVAIKVLPADATRDEKRRRMFLQEARLASSVSDAHIAQVHELGREGDLDFIVMEYVEGSPLSRILQSRALPPEEVASLGEQVAKALSRAHRKGLLHRDLKPGNILVTPDGEVKVVDFGLATLFARPEITLSMDAPTLSVLPGVDGEITRTESTQRGGIVGTVPYMSPEQVRGEMLEARSDIFSLGAVLYEMTTGSRPFLGATGAEVMQAILKARPVPISECMQQVPLDLERIIQKAMAPHRGDRYQTMEDLAVDLKQLGRQLETGTLGAHTILILPLEARGQFVDAQYVGLAFSEAVAVSLAQVKTLKILPVPPEDFHKSSDPLASNRAARALGAGYYLKGALTREGEAIRASVTLVDPDQNRVLWGSQKDGTSDDLPRLANLMAQEVGLQLGVAFPKYYDITLNLMGGPEMSISPLTAEALGALKRLDIPLALEATEQLVQAFPSERDALAMRVSALTLAWDRDRSLSGRRELEQNIALLDLTDPKNPYGEVHRNFMLLVERKAKEALTRLTLLLARDDFTPSLRANILVQRASANTSLGRFDSALTDLEVARSLDPVNASVIAGLSKILVPLGRPEEAVNRARQWVALSPSDWKSYHGLGWVLGSLGRWEESLLPFRESCQMSQDQAACVHYAYALLKIDRTAEGITAAANAAALSDSVDGTWGLACFWAVAGNRADALRYLHRSLELGFARSIITSDPDLDPLRGDPEFQAIVAEVKQRLASQ